MRLNIFEEFYHYHWFPLFSLKCPFYEQTYKLYFYFGCWNDHNFCCQNLQHSCRFPGVNLSKCEYITFDELRYEWTSCLSLVLISFKISYLPKSLLSTICGKKEKAFEHLLLLDGIIWLDKLKYSNENTKYVFWGNFTYLPENGCRFLK